ncbi:MAG: hypothetical protein M3298_00940 [Thermoproteota archaeon]|nr:hypothetical protein [Thermoproteota archaeon]
MENYMDLGSMYYVARIRFFPPHFEAEGCKIHVCPHKNCFTFLGQQSYKKTRLLEGVKIRIILFYHSESIEEHMLQFRNKNT